MKGTIKKWFEFRGFGFIDVEGQENDVFVHTSDVSGFAPPKVGDIVEFDVEESYKGPRAVHVKIT